MKKKMLFTGKRMAAAGLLMALGLAVCGCGSSYDKASDFDLNGAYDDSYVQGDSYDYGVETAAEASGMDVYEDDVSDMDDSMGITQTGSDSANVKNDVTKGKKIIKTYDYTFETENFDTAYDYLRSQVSKNNGYVSSSNLNGTVRRTLYLTARIPVDDCDNFISGLGELGTVVSQSESAEDITLQYADTESRITSLKTEQKRLNELMEEATDIDYIITLESRLTEVRYELENYQSQKMRYDDLVDYCTVNIRLTEVSYTVEVDEESVLSRIRAGLKTTFRDLQYSFEDFIVWLVVSLPYLVVWALIIFIIVLIIKGIIKSHKKRKAKRRAKKEAKKEAQQDAAAGQAEVQQADAAEQTEAQQDAAGQTETQQDAAAQTEAQQDAAGQTEAASDKK